MIRNSASTQHQRRYIVGTPVEDRAASHLHRGWNDSRLGVPYPRAYDAWDGRDQQNYEHGRRMAAVLARGGVVPEWRADQPCPLSEMPAYLRPAWDEEQAFTMKGIALAPTGGTNAS